ncbi:MAG: SUMF1/EgtB/PvdO family nonheme iron enzyme [Phycisphaerales bacterium]|nr:SUMF1/EgtB/PvdO family nonheme iron enzyme [Phycisphaerales bacterium]
MITKKLCFALAASALLACGLVAQAITIETVVVGNPGNAAQPTAQLGAVAYEYEIGKFEVTIGQYVAFLNAVAATDTYGLASVAGGLVTQSGSSGSYTYAAATNPDRPIAGISWAKAARFANWMHNGQPTGAQALGTTEDGSYYLNGANDAPSLIAVTRAAGATWVIPTINEWYKAAHYSPANSAYYFYAYMDNVATTTKANYAGSVGSSTVVGSYAFPSEYGTYDQSGNVHEWTEEVASSDNRILMGGQFNWDATWMQGWNGQNLSQNVTQGYPPHGFRLALVPEPATLAFIALGTVGLLIRRRGQ